MSADLIARLIAAGTPAELVGEVAMALASAQAEANALAKGYRRGLTYILDSEWRTSGGASLIAAGWHYLWRVDGRSWDCESRARIDKHPLEDKHAFGWGAWRELARQSA